LMKRGLAASKSSRRIANLSTGEHSFPLRQGVAQTLNVKVVLSESMCFAYATERGKRERASTAYPSAAIVGPHELTS